MTTDPAGDPATDERSVGELLTETDRISRTLLYEVTGDEARPLARGWPPLVAAAAGLWRAIPDLAPGARGPDPMDRLVVASHAATREAKWPGAGPLDDRLADSTDLFRRAAHLVHEHKGDLDPKDLRVHADSRAARLRIMHTLYLTSHAIGLSLHQHLGDIDADRADRGGREARTRPLGWHSTQDRIRRFALVEQVAGSYVSRHFAAVAHGEHVPPPPWGGDRLAEALAAWDIQARRTLTGDYTTRDLLEASRMQAEIVAATGALLTAEFRTGQLNQGNYGRLVSPLEHSQNAWRRASDRWADLRLPGVRTDPHLAQAAGEVRAAVRELAYEKTIWANPDVIASRVHLPELHEPLQLALGAGTDIGALLTGIAAHDADLAGPARAIALRCGQDVDHGLSPDLMAAPVSPTAVHLDIPVNIAPVRAQLVAACRRATTHTAAAARAAACLDRLARPPQAADPWQQDRRLRCRLDDVIVDRAAPASEPRDPATGSSRRDRGRSVPR